MREGIKTSLLSVVCVMAVSAGAFAAPSVRSVGGAGAYPSAASAAGTTTTAARAGSLRPSGGYIRPTTSVSTKSTTAAAPSSTSTVGSATTSVRSASAPRLSIGKYIGTPVSISSSGGSGTDYSERLDQIEQQIHQLQVEKQSLLQSTDYITIEGNEAILNVERLLEDLDLEDGEDGHQIQLDADNNDGIKWRYIANEGEEQSSYPWQTLITWATLKTKLGIDDINGLIQAAISSLRTEIQARLDGKVDKDQGVTNEGKILVVGGDGKVSLSDTPLATDLSGKVDKDQGEDNAGKLLIIDSDGMVTVADEALGNLAYKNKVDTAEIEAEAVTSSKIKDGEVTTDKLHEGAVIREKLANDIVGVLDWANWWKTNAPGQDALLSVDADGNQQWFVVIDE